MQFHLFCNKMFLRELKRSVQPVYKRKLTQKTEDRILSSPIKNLVIPKIPIHEYIYEEIRKWPEKVAIKCTQTNREYTYNEVYIKSKNLSHSLSQILENEEGQQNVAVILPNVPEYSIIVLATLAAGAVVTPISSLLTPEEMSHQLQFKVPKLIFTSTSLWYHVITALQIGKFQTSIKIVAIRHDYNIVPLEAIQFEDLCAAVSEVRKHANVSYENTAFHLFSSGTTGLPKAVELTHYNIVANLCQIAHPLFDFSRKSYGSFQDVVPAIMPFSHTFGVTVILLHSLCNGCKILTVPKFSIPLFKELSKSQKPTVLNTVSNMIFILMKHKDVSLEDLISYRVMTTGGTPFTLSDMVKFNEKTKGKITLLQSYGMTEMSPLSHAQVNDAESNTPGSCGRLVPNTQGKIVKMNDGNTALGENLEGELWIKGPQVMKGYYKNEEATKTTLIQDGWIRTGDVASYDEHGRFYIKDRLKEIIKVKGFQVAPAEIEAVIRQHPNVQEVAVVGVPHSKFGEAPKAYVLPRLGMALKATDIEEIAAKKLAKHKHLAGGVIVTDNLPTNSTGKINKKLLKQMQLRSV